jgi:hypothetical protein
MVTARRVASHDRNVNFNEGAAVAVPRISGR